VLGLEMDVVQQQLAAAREAPGAERRSSLGGATAAGDGGSDGASTVEFRGRTVRLPDGLTREMVQPILDKMGHGGGPEAFQSLSQQDRSILTRVMRAAGGGGDRRGNFGGGQRGGGRRPLSGNFQFGGEFIVFVMTDTGPEARPIRTGLTDLDYAQVMSGLSTGDQVLILPSASLVQSQREFQERMSRYAGRAIPGLRGRR